MDLPQLEFSCINLMKGKGLDLKGVKISLMLAYTRSRSFSRFKPEPSKFDGCSNLEVLILAVLILAKRTLGGQYLVSLILTTPTLQEPISVAPTLVDATDVTCEQIESAVIDKDTRFPDYILLDGSSPIRIQLH